MKKARFLRTAFFVSNSITRLLEKQDFSSPVILKLGHDRRGLVVIRIFFHGEVEYLVEFFLVSSI
jgi:hypothetical protein